MDGWLDKQLILNQSMVINFSLLGSFILQVDVGTNQDVVEEEDLSLFRLDNLTFITKNHLSEHLTVNQLFAC